MIEPHTRVIEKESSDPVGFEELTFTMEPTPTIMVDGAVMVTNDKIVKATVGYGVETLESVDDVTSNVQFPNAVSGYKRATSVPDDKIIELFVYVGTEFRVQLNLFTMPLTVSEPVDPMFVKTAVGYIHSEPGAGLL